MACKIHTYLLLEYSAVARYMEHLSSVGQRGLLASREGAMAPLVHPFPWLRPCIHTIAYVREHLDYCDGSLSDIVCNLCMVDKSNLTNRSLVTDGD